MTLAQKKRITILVDSLSTGGAEKSAGILSELLYNANYDVSVISLKDKITYQYKGQLLNLGVSISSVKQLKQYQKFVRLKKALENQNPDFVLDFRMRNRKLIEFLFHIFIFYKYKMVFTIHNFFVDYHLPKGDFFVRAYNKQIVTAVSKDIKVALEANYGLKNVHYVPNAIDQRGIQTEASALQIKDKYIIAVGRLYNEVKQFDKLIEAYKASSLPSKGIKLYILGEGIDDNILKTQIATLNMNGFVKLTGFISNPYPYIKQAQFLVLCSKFEGLPMVILEALALNTPVVSFSCKSGPSEMIEHNVNGMLVEDQNFEEFGKAMDYLIENPVVLEKMRSKTTKNLTNYSEEQQLKYWKQILN
jgi:N-acetylgalactosamine-N,N'-diacetylbacillosaminyl-diphospho-undecaprenol 4-alpha-N-acetylgalactosaminyltransferase